MTLSMVVVYLLIPTSNHNLITIVSPTEKLYIFWFLHQATTFGACVPSFRRCISFDSYIKPQPAWGFILYPPVVYLLIPTSNHNTREDHQLLALLYIFWFLHQTTTLKVNTTLAVCCISFDSYIKPQRLPCQIWMSQSCISFDSYIKPQLSAYRRPPGTGCISFDSYIKPQLTHTECGISRSCISFDSYIKPQLKVTLL